MSIEIKLQPGVPSSEFSQEFVQGMANRMSASFFKYGRVMDAVGKVDEIASLKKRLDKYVETGNTEWLMDVANFAMIEFMQKGAVAFRATDSHESPGLARNDGKDANAAHSNVVAEASNVVKPKPAVQSDQFYRRQGD